MAVLDERNQKSYFTLQKISFSENKMILYICVHGPLILWQIEMKHETNKVVVINFVLS